MIIEFYEFVRELSILRFYHLEQQEKVTKSD